MLTNFVPYMASGLEWMNKYIYISNHIFSVLRPPFKNMDSEQDKRLTHNSSCVRDLHICARNKKIKTRPKWTRNRPLSIERYRKYFYTFPRPNGWKKNSFRVDFSPRLVCSGRNKRKSFKSRTTRQAYLLLKRPFTKEIFVKQKKNEVRSIPYVTPRSALTRCRV